MPQGKDDGAAGASFTISEWSGDTNQTFELDSEDIPPNFDTQTWEWVEFLPELNLKPEKRLHRKALEIVAAGQFIFGDTLAPNGEFPRWLPETTVLNTIREIQFLCGHDSVNARELSPEQIKTYMDADDNSTIVPDKIATRPFFKAINQLQHCRYILSLGRERGLEAINAPGVIRTQRDSENSLGMVELVNSKLESFLETHTLAHFVSKLESAGVSNETRQAVNDIASQPKEVFRESVQALPVNSKREIVKAFGSDPISVAHEAGTAIKKRARENKQRKRATQKSHESEKDVINYILREYRKKTWLSKRDAAVRIGPGAYKHARKVRAVRLFRNVDPNQLNLSTEPLRFVYEVIQKHGGD